MPAAAGPKHPFAMPRLDHVWVIMMENHGYVQIINNPYAPFANQEAQSANLAANYFAVAHPSLTNYLEVIGGSNFGVTDDNSPDWHNSSCQPNIVSGVNNNEADPNPICPIAGSGTDQPTPALDCSNEVNGCPPGPVINIDGIESYSAAATVGAMIGDQLAAAGKSWKSYQESLPPGGADGVDYGDGQFSNLTNFTQAEISLGETTGAEVQLYAAKHNPFAYFASVQSGTIAGDTLANSVDFATLYGDLATNKAPALSFIAPNQCNDQHGRGNAGPFCAFDPNDNGTQTGLNPALIQQGDQSLQKIVTAIKASPVWGKGHNAIVILWDEDDYSVSPTTNQVALIVDTNFAKKRVTSNNFYNHFNLTNTLEAAFGLPCLNHACDPQSYPMADLFQR
ncbi:MAG TPA: alkaline phosphatase family protein [Rhizomicrobium sp.]|nr:alkaline phosphatase family protein [Rhizomicrobium sp.]